jgi:mRNA degradation ribonuclease J1/J2
LLLTTRFLPAYGFIVHTSEGAVVYTGDLRRHGPRKDLTENFIAKAKEAEILLR